MNQLDEKDLELHVPLLGWINIVSSSIYLLLGVCGFLFFTGIGLIPAAEGNPVGLYILGILGTLGLLFFGVLALPGLLAGYGLLKRQRWGQILGMVIGVLDLISFPVGTAIGIYTLFVLLQNSATDYFAAQEPALAAQGPA